MRAEGERFTDGSLDLGEDEGNHTDGGLKNDVLGLLLSIKLFLLQVAKESLIEVVGRRKRTRRRRRRRRWGRRRAVTRKKRKKEVNLGGRERVEKKMGRDEMRDEVGVKRRRRGKSTNGRRAVEVGQLAGGCAKGGEGGPQKGRTVGKRQKGRQERADMFKRREVKGVGKSCNQRGTIADAQQNIDKNG